MYEIRPSNYYIRGRNLYEQYENTKNKALLIYAALEFRICIERYLFEALVLLKIEDIPKKYEKLYRAKELSITILEIEPELIKKLEFINIFLEALEVGIKIFIPDLSYLNELYGKLGLYLHTIKDPDKSVLLDNWWGNLSSVLLKSQSYLEKMIIDDFGSFDLNEDGLRLFEKWENGILNTTQLTDIIKTGDIKTT